MRQQTETVSEAAERLFPGVTFDTALPQPWVDWAREKGTDVRGHFVWGYDDKAPTFGRPLPLTDKAVLFLEDIDQ